MAELGPQPVPKTVSPQACAKEEPHVWGLSLGADLVSSVSEHGGEGAGEAPQGPTWPRGCGQSTAAAPGSGCPCEAGWALGAGWGGCLTENLGGGDSPSRCLQIAFPEPKPFKV